MTFDDELEQRLRELGDAVAPGPPIVGDVMRRIEQTSIAPVPPARIRSSRIMHSKTLKWIIPAAAAAAVAVVIFPVGWFSLTASAPAYALEQTIEASKAIRSLHLKFIEAGVDESPERQCGKEFWMEYDANGQLIRQRRDWHEGGKSGTDVWEGGIEKGWYAPKNEFRVQYDPMAVGMSESFISRCDPKLVAETLHSLMAAGKLSIEISEPQGGDIKLTVKRIVPEPEVPPWWAAEKFIVLVDPVTKLLKQRDSYFTRDGREQIDQRWTYLGYNEAFDPSIFVLTPPEGMKVDDRTAGSRGMPQGNLTDAQVAVAVVRQYIEAKAAEDHEKAASFLCRSTAEESRSWTMRVGKVVRLVWTGEAVPASGMGSRVFEVPFTYEIEKADGKRTLVGPKSEHPERGGPLQHRAAVVCPVPGHPDRWFIAGGI